jgi:hypothetical protein
MSSVIQQLAIPIGAIGTRNSNAGNWPIGNSIQFNSPNFNDGNSMGLAKEAELMPSRRVASER